MNKLSSQKINVSVPGKIILIGEHSVVYGHTAIAMPLSDIRLSLTIQKTTYDSWDDVWDVSMLGKQLALTEHFKSLLTQSFSLALSLFEHKLSDFIPQKMQIASDIPLGGGMGGSAAVSASFIRLCKSIFESQISLETEIEYANKIDSLFHSGRASGLDVATILTEKLISFTKENSFQTIQSKSSFYLALVDTNERSETSIMINIVSALMQKKMTKALTAMEKLNKLACDCVLYLKNNSIEKFTQNIDAAQLCLEDLHVSTPTIKKFCATLKSFGALGTKLTGAGGGGLVLAIFKENPSFLKNHFPNNKVFVTKV